jgi:hypothetical protein
MSDKSNVLARQIVGHLGMRWLSERRAYRSFCGQFGQYHGITERQYSRIFTAWNAFESCRRILYGHEL